MSIAKSCLKCGIEMQSDGKFIWCEDCDVRKYEMDSYYARPPEGTAPSLEDEIEKLKVQVMTLEMDIGVLEAQQRGEWPNSNTDLVRRCEEAEAKLAQAAPTGAGEPILVTEFTSEMVFANMLRHWTPEQCREFYAMLSRRPDFALQAGAEQVREALDELDSFIGDHAQAISRKAEGKAKDAIKVIRDALSQPSPSNRATDIQDELRSIYRRIEKDPDMVEVAHHLGKSLMYWAFHPVPLNPPGESSQEGK